MPTPPDQNIPLIHLPVGNWKQPQKGSGRQQPGFFGAGVAYGAEPERGKVYVVPPFSFSFNFKLGPLQFAQSLSWTGFSFKDLPWAKDASDWFAHKAAWLDFAGLVTSGVSVGTQGDPSRLVALVVAGVDTGIGVLATTATALSDVFGGNTGYVATDGTNEYGSAVGRDTIVSTRNLALGTVANGLGLIPGAGIPLSIGGLYVSASQLNYDIQGLQGHKGGYIVVDGHGADNRALFKQAVLDDWFLFDNSPGSVAARDAIREGVLSAGDEIRNAGERLGQPLPAWP
jgi:hypothetical protein